MALKKLKEKYAKNLQSRKMQESSCKIFVLAGIQTGGFLDA